ncbi:hypothetical protein SAMN02910369_01625 [Lachnospiraceae bacterium NE2001]|nr:hypothetical protein SAMN02910369_01625 [Lachnospiraceae bacterium NE2001]
MSSVFASDIFVILLIGLVGFVIPGVLTVWNIYNCIAEKPKWEKFISSLTIFIGGIFYLVLFFINYDEAGEWYEQVNSMQYHNSISSEYGLVYVIVMLGFAGYFLLLFLKADELPPLLSAISISLMILMNVFQIAYAIQISKNVDGLDCLLYVYHANILILSARAVHRHMKETVEIFKGRISDDENHKKISFIFKKINSLSKYSIFLFVVLFFVIAVLEVIFVLLGQGLDAPLKAFTDTADWTFSKQIPPPPLEYDGHYLCTVAAGGHRKVVKPIRLGTRRNETIIVNRQLCIANAFEELIQEKTPRFHKKVRGFYDTYGYPLSRKITSPIRADFIYIIMKPLEWLFLIFLYAFDLRPEQRISRQYTYVEPGGH